MFTYTRVSYIHIHYVYRELEKHLKDYDNTVSRLKSTITRIKLRVSLSPIYLYIAIRWFDSSPNKFLLSLRKNCKIHICIHTYIYIIYMYILSHKIFPFKSL